MEDNSKMSVNQLCILDWSSKDTELWLRKEDFSEESIAILCDQHFVNGKCLLALNEQDFALEPLSLLSLRDRKSLYLAVKLLQRENHNSLVALGITESPSVTLYSSHGYVKQHDYSDYCESDRISPPASDDGRTQRLPPEIFKAFLSLCYVIAVTWITAFVMVIVHDRVPDMNKYPPLPDIFLDNVPHIPWAFDMCEITGTVLFTIWLLVLLFHKHR